MENKGLFVLLGIALTGAAAGIGYYIYKKKKAEALLSNYNTDVTAYDEINNSTSTNEGEDQSSIDNDENAGPIIYKKNSTWTCDYFMDERPDCFYIPNEEDVYEVCINKTKLITSNFNQNDVDNNNYPPAYLIDADLLQAWAFGNISELPIPSKAYINNIESVDVYLDNVDFVNPEQSGDIILGEPSSDDDVFLLFGPNAGAKFANLINEKRMVNYDGTQFGFINELMGIGIVATVYSSGGNADGE